MGTRIVPGAAASSAAGRAGRPGAACAAFSFSAAAGLASSAAPLSM